MDPRLSFGSQDPFQPSPGPHPGYSHGNSIPQSFVPFIPGPQAPPGWPQPHLFHPNLSPPLPYPPGAPRPSFNPQQFAPMNGPNPGQMAMPPPMGYSGMPMPPLNFPPRQMNPLGAVPPPPPEQLLSPPPPRPSSVMGEENAGPTTLSRAPSSSKGRASTGHTPRQRLRTLSRAHSLASTPHVQPQSQPAQQQLQRGQAQTETMRTAASQQPPVWSTGTSTTETTPLASTLGAPPNRQALRKSSGIPGSPAAAGRVRTTSPHSRPQSGAGSGRQSRISSASPRRAGSARPLGMVSMVGSPALTVLDDSDNIKVAVRVRPLSDTEVQRGDSCVLNIGDERRVDVMSGPSVSRSFPFHACIGPDAGQADVMHLCGIPQLLDAALEGYNVTIFAYGQTGSGKSFTISGAEDEPSYTPSWDGQGTTPSSYGDGEGDGIVPRSLAYIFRQVESRNTSSASLSSPTAPAPVADSTGATPSEDPAAASPAEQPPVGDGCLYSVRASYCEIYNEALYDLLKFDQRQLALRWDPARGFHAPELHIQQCPSLAEARAAVSRGLRHRRLGSHNLNLESSRSHSILTVHIDASTQRPDAPDFGTTRMGKVVFVDLAGSERLKDSQSAGDALRETASINRSLFMLGKVISALAAGAKGALVPYRESKLTKLLMDSLGGSALSLMIACCSPSAMHVDETLSTLSYACRAKNIRNAPTVQMDPHEAALSALRRELRLLRTENAFLREQFMLASEQNRGFSAIEKVGGAEPPASCSLLPGNSTASPSPSVTAALPAHSVMVPLPSGSPEQQSDLARRLVETQRLMSTLASDNARLAVENDRLRAGGLQVAGDYSGAVEEVEWLRAKLARLEVSLLGVGVSEEEPQQHQETRINEMHQLGEVTKGPASELQATGGQEGTPKEESEALHPDSIHSLPKQSTHTPEKVMQPPEDYGDVASTEINHDGALPHSSQAAQLEPIEMPTPGGGENALFFAEKVPPSGEEEDTGATAVVTLMHGTLNKGTALEHALDRTELEELRQFEVAGELGDGAN